MARRDGAERYEFHDPAFRRIAFGNARLEMLWTGGRWTEGPVYHPAGKFLLFSDIPNDRVLRYDETDGSVSVFEQPARNANGHFLDREGRVLRCEHRGRCVSRIEHDGARTVVCDRFEGRRLNSPNDVTVHPDGGIWFSDPTYGIDHDYEGDAAEPELGACRVYRAAPAGAAGEGEAGSAGAAGPAQAMVTDMLRPNGLAFSPDARRLYVSETGVSHDPECAPRLRVYPVAESGDALGAGADFAPCDAGVYDGLRCDTEGRVWAAAGDGVHCLSPDGRLLGKVLAPEACANVCFGGPKRNRLFICGTESLYAIFVNARGMGLPPP